MVARPGPVLVDQPIKDDKLSDIFTQSMEGFASRLRNLFPEKRVSVVDGSLDAAKKQLQRQGQQIKYPFFAVQFRGSDINRDGYNVKALLRRGKLGAQIGDAQTNTTDSFYHLIPTNVDITVQFQTNDIRDVYAFTQRWTLAATQNLFQMWIEAADTSDPRNRAPIDIRVELNPQLQIPELNADERDTDYTYEATALMRTYMGTIRQKMRLVGHKMNFGTVSVLGMQNPDGSPTVTDSVEISTNFVKKQRTVTTKP